MSVDLIQSIYNGAASIAQPLSLAALLATFITIIIRQIVKSLERPLGDATSQDAIKVVLSALRYLFILCLVALAGGLLSYALEFFLKDYVKKYSIINSARAAMSMKDPIAVKKYADQLIKNYPDCAEGYRYSGIANFYAMNYSESAKDFASALRVLPASEIKCDNTRRDFVFNLAAAQAAAGAYPESLSSMKSMENCWSEKSELFNHGKILIMNGLLNEAEKVLSSEILNNPGRPNYVSPVSLERGILEIKVRKSGWEERAIGFFKKSICNNRDFEQIILRGKSNERNDPAGMVAEYDYEIDILNDPVNAQFLKVVQGELNGVNPCGS